MPCGRHRAGSRPANPETIPSRKVSQNRMHRWSQLFIPTLREAPADAEVASHKLLLRAGYIRQLGAGIYSYLFLGNRAINKIVAIVREEMDTIGQEMHLPALNPREVWEESGRWAGMGDTMFRLKDRRSEEHTSELQSLRHLVCRLLLEKKNHTVQLVEGNAASDHQSLSDTGEVIV